MKKYIFPFAIFSISMYIIAGVLVFALTRNAITYKEIAMPTYSQTGQIGDTLGGITSPFIGVIAAALTFLAFWIQIEANKKLSDQFKEEQNERNRNGFDANLQSLILQNREIAKNTTIGSATSNNTWTKIYFELKIAYEIIRIVFGENIHEADAQSLAFCIFLHGVGPNSDKPTKELFKHIPDLDKLLASFANIKNMVNTRTYSTISESMMNELKSLGYLPFEGNQTRLGHYFRSLYHVLTYAKSQEGKLFTKGEIYQKIKSLRTQMSTYEQILILFNAGSPYGAELISQGFLHDYKLVKNIPLPFIDFLQSTPKILSDIDLEWSEIVRRSEAMAQK